MLYIMLLDYIIDPPIPHLGQYLWSSWTEFPHPEQNISSLVHTTRDLAKMARY